MCWKCDNPTATDEDYFSLIQEVIDSREWFVQGVQKDRLRPEFSYTIGLTALGFPELLVTGLPHAFAADLLNAVAHQLVHHDASTFVAGDRLGWNGEGLIEVVDVAEPTVHLVYAYGMYGPDIRAMQLVYVDDLGKWPWD